MQLPMSKRTLGAVLLAIVFGGSLLLAGDYAITSYVITAAQGANTESMSQMMAGQPNNMMGQPDMMSMMGEGSMGSGMMDMMAMMQMCQGMMQQMSGSGMMPMQQGLKPLSLDQAVEKAQDYLKSLNNPDLVLAEVIEFDNHFYFIIKEKSTGVYAFESLMDMRTGSVHPAPGPNLMWNTKYGMTAMMQDMMSMGNMMGMDQMMSDMASPSGMMMGGPTPIEPTAELPISPEKAKQTARQFLEKTVSSMSQMPMTMQMPMPSNPLQGAVVGEKVRKFYGYYTLDLVKDGKLAGLLSVNGYTGQVWQHTWNANFVNMKELGK